MRKMLLFDIFLFDLIYGNSTLSLSFVNKYNVWLCNTTGGGLVWQDWKTEILPAHSICEYVTVGEQGGL